MIEWVGQKVPSCACLDWGVLKGVLGGGVFGGDYATIVEHVIGFRGSLVVNSGWIK